MPAQPGVLLGFTGIPLLSKPSALAYDYNGANQIVIDFDKDYAPLPDATVYGPNATKSTATAAAGPDIDRRDNTCIGDARPGGKSDQPDRRGSGKQHHHKAQLSQGEDSRQQSEAAGVGGSNDSGQKSAVGSSITSSLNATRERLAATRANLDKQTKNDTSNNTSTSNVPLNSTLNSTSNSTLNNTLNKTPNSTPNGMQKSISSMSA